MPSVAAMLRWGLPPCMVYAVALLKFSGTVPTDQPLDFAEYFAGCGAVSHGLWEATCMKTYCHFFPVAEMLFVKFDYFGMRGRQSTLGIKAKAGYRGISLDIDFDPHTQDLTSCGGFLRLGCI